VKFYAGVRGVPVVHWSRGKMDKVITKNFEEKFRELFEDIRKGQVFHEYFYECVEDKEAFEKKWEKTVKLLEDVRKLLFKR
jgi:ketol-acid reductoisomerase